MMQQGISSLPGAQAAPQAPGQAPMPQVTPPKQAPTPQGITGQLDRLPPQQLLAMFANPGDKTPKWAVVSAYAKAVENQKLMAAAQGQSAMQQNQAQQGQPPVAAQVMSQGLPALPGAQSFSGGGAVAFAGGNPTLERLPGETDEEYAQRQQAAVKGGLFESLPEESWLRKASNWLRAGRPRMEAPIISLPIAPEYPKTLPTAPRASSGTVTAASAPVPVAAPAPAAASPTGWYDTAPATAPAPSDATGSDFRTPPAVRDRMEAERLRLVQNELADAKRALAVTPPGSSEYQRITGDIAALERQLARLPAEAARVSSGTGTGAPVGVSAPAGVGTPTGTSTSASTGAPTGAPAGIQTLPSVASTAPAAGLASILPELPAARRAELEATEKEIAAANARKRAVAEQLGKPGEAELASRAEYLKALSDLNTPQQKAAEAARAQAERSPFFDPVGMSQIAAAASGAKRFGQGLGAAVGAGGAYMGEQRKRADALEAEYNRLESQRKMLAAQAARADAVGDEKLRTTSLASLAEIEEAQAKNKYERQKAVATEEVQRAEGIAKLGTAQAALMGAQAHAATVAKPTTEEFLHGLFVKNPEEFKNYLAAKLSPKTDAAERKDILRALVSEAAKNPLMFSQLPPEFMTAVKQEVLKLGMTSTPPQGAQILK